MVLSNPIRVIRGHPDLLHREKRVSVTIVGRFRSDTSTSARKTLCHDRAELRRVDIFHDAAAKLARSGAALGVAAGVLAHQHRALCRRRTARRPARNGAAAAARSSASVGSGGIGSPRSAAAACRNSHGLAERRPGDHHAVDVVAAKRLDHFLRRIEIAVADQRNPLQVRLDRRDAVPIGRAAEKYRPPCGRAPSAPPPRPLRRPGPRRSR